MYTYTCINNVLLYHMCVQIIQEIEDHYFDEGDIDCSQHELEVISQQS